MKKPEFTRSRAGLTLRSHLWLVATLMPLLERILPLKRLLRLLTPPRWCRPYAGTSSEEIRRLTERRLRAPRQMRRRACLRQGLTLFHFLRLANYPGVLHIGVFPPQLDRRRLHAHCWVTLNGVPVSPPPDQPVATLLTLDGADDRPAPPAPQT